MAKNEMTVTAGSTAMVMDEAMYAMVEESAGLGVDTLSEEDCARVEIKIAQQTSPQLKAKNAKYIPGLTQGDLFNSASGKIYGKSVKLAILGVYKAIVVWSSLDDISSTPPEEDVMQCVNPKRYAEILNGCTVVDGKRIYKGTKKVNTVYRLAAVAFDDDGTYEPVMIECAKTRYKNAKQLNTLLTNIRYADRTGRLHQAPSCIAMIKMEVAEAGNENNDWYEFKFSRVMEDELLAGGFFKTGLAQSLISEAKILRDGLVSGSIVMSGGAEEIDTSDVVFDSADAGEEVF